MLESDGLEPVNADMDAIRIVAARDLKIPATRCAGSDKHGIVIFLKQSFQAFNRVIHLKIDIHVEDVADFFVKNLGWQSKLRNVRPHQTARRLKRLKNCDLVTQRGQIIRNR